MAGLEDRLNFLEVNEGARVEKCAVLPNCFIIDDFYKDPHLVREVASSRKYKKGIISGTDSLIGKPRVNETKDILMQICSLTKVGIADWARISNVYDFWLESGCGEFQARLCHQKDKGKIHSHPQGQWAAIIYLSLPEDCEGRDGTLFYEHLDSGKRRYENISKEFYEVLKVERDYPEKWDCYHQVPMKFNRLVLFDSLLFHSESEGFGDCVENCRLIHIFNFKCLGEL